LTRLLCILTTLLGNKSTTQRLTDAIAKLPEVKPTYVVLDSDDYARYRVPAWARITNPWHVQHIARRKVQPVLSQSFDALFVYSWEFVVVFRDLARKIPGAALMDSVPATVDQQQLRRRGLGDWKRSISHRLHHRAFLHAARDFRVFLPMGSDCRDSLENDYGIPRERCFITLAPQDLNVWKPSQRSYSPPLQLLFVANDFVRKGGEFLLRLYTNHLSRFCRLTIASNDPALESRELPLGVALLRGRNRDQLLQIYQQSDIFLFPTEQDYMPQALAEALATGLPCIGNDVGGIRDLVRNGETGFLMSCNETPQNWAERIQRLIEHPAELSRLSEGARRFAEQSLSVARFESLISSVVDSLSKRS